MCRERIWIVLNACGRLVEVEGERVCSSDKKDVRIVGASQEEHYTSGEVWVGPKTDFSTR